MAWTWADFVLLAAFAVVVVLTARYLLECGVPAWSAVGIAIMSADLIILGVFQGYMWASLAPWSDVIQFSIPWWALRIVSGVMIFASHMIFMTHMLLTWMKAVAERKQEAASNPSTVAQTV